MSFNSAFLYASPYGSPTGRENLNRVRAALGGQERNASGISFEERSLLAAYGGFGSSLIARFPAASESEGTFVLAVSIDDEFAVDTALAMTEKLKQESHSVEVLVAFLGDEKNELPLIAVPATLTARDISHKGLRDLLTLNEAAENWVLCYLDANEVPGELELQHGIRGNIAPLEIIDALTRLMKAAGIPSSFRIRHNTVYKLGFAEGSESMRIAWEKEVNGFVLSGKAASKGNSFSGGETVSALILAELLLEYSESLVFPVTGPDRHYSIFHLPNGEIYFLGERAAVIMLLAAAAIMLAIYMIYSARRSVVWLYHFRMLLRSVWILLILLPLMTVSIKASGFLYSRLIALFDIPPGMVNNAGVGLTILLAISVFVLLSPVFRLIRFPMRARFYGFSAAIFIIAGTLFASFLDLGFVPVFLWASVFVFFGAALPRPFPVFLSVLFIPVFAATGLFNLLETGSGRFAELFFPINWNSIESWAAAVLTSLFALPLFLLAKRGIILFQRSNRKETIKAKKYKAVYPLVLTAFVLLAMLAQVLLIKRPALPVRRFVVEDAGSSAGTSGGLLLLTLGETIFRNSRILNIRLESSGNPMRFDLSLEGSNVLPPLYSASVPFEREDGGKRINFILGEYPPNPLTLEIVLPLEFDSSVIASSLYNEWDPALDSKEKPDSTDYVLVVSKSAALHPALQNYQRNSTFNPFE